MIHQRRRFPLKTQSSDLLGPRASPPQMSAKREQSIGESSFEKLRACWRFAGGTPAVPAIT